jgi:hypothetical protein
MLLPSSLTTDLSTNLHDVISLERVIFILTGMRTPSLTQFKSFVSINIFSLSFVKLIMVILGSQNSEGLWAGRPEFYSPQRQDIFLYSTASRPALGPTQPSIQWVQEALSPRDKRLGHEADHSPSSSAEVKNGGAIPSLPRTSSWRGA